MNAMQSVNTPLLIAWKALSTLAIVAAVVWYGTTFVGNHDPIRVAHHQTVRN
jgi:hypothetical protein